ncbi:MAG: tetratricopeptide (TPR) repeat protein [Myxococcota bacterium]|jgi:tetratricopeptide (TPR) repeat protein
MKTVLPIILALTTSLIAGQPLAAPPVTLADAEAHLVAGRRGEAAKMLTHLSGHVKAPARVFLLKGVLEREAGDLPAAARTLEQGATAKPTDAMLWVELAVTRSWQGDLKRALRGYERALEADPTLRPAQVGRARILGWLGELDAAAQAYDAILREEANHVEATVGRAWVHREARETGAAKALYERVLAAVPEHAEATNGLRAVAAQRDHRLRVEGGLSDTHSEAGLSWSWRLSRQLTAQASYLWGTSTFSIPGAVEQQHRFQASLSTRLGPRTMLTTGYRLDVSDRTKHAAMLDLALPLGPSVSLLSGISPTFSGRGTGLEARLGGTLALGAVDLISVGYLALAPEQEQGSAATIGAIWSIVPTLRGRLTLSASWLGEASAVPGVDVSLRWQMSRAIALFSSAGWQFDSPRRQRLRAGLEFTL